MAKDQNMPRPLADRSAGGHDACSGSCVRQRQVRPWLVLVLVTVIAYLPVYSAGYVWDDDMYVTRNTTLRSWHGLGRIWAEPGATPQYYPVTFSSFWLEYQLFGLNPAVSHAVNVLLHAVNAVLLFCILERLRVWGAFLGACLFALHPVHVESVAWITERKNVLSGVLFLASLLLWLRFKAEDDAEGRDSPAWRIYGASLALFVLALLSKSVACSLPGVVLVIRWWRRGRLCRRDGWLMAPFVLLGGWMAYVTVWMERNYVLAQGAEWDISIAGRTLIAGRALWFYAWKLVWPHPLLFNYPRWRIDSGAIWQYVFPVGVLVLVSVLFAARNRVGRGPLAIVLLFSGMLLPGLGFINVYPMRFSFVADHFQYLASAALLALMGALMQRLPERTQARRHPARLVVGTGLCLCLGVLTFYQASLYRHPALLWFHTLAGNPGSFLAHNGLATMYFKHGDMNRAMVHFRKSLEINPNNPRTHYNLGVLASRAGDQEQAVYHYEEAVRLEPGDTEAVLLLADALVQRGCPDLATQRLVALAKADPSCARAHYQMGLIHASAGELDSSVKALAEAVRIDPGFSEAHYNLGIALYMQGKRMDALGRFRQVLARCPDDADAHERVALILTDLEQYAQASRHSLAAAGIKDQAGAHTESARLRHLDLGLGFEHGRRVEGGK